MRYLDLAGMIYNLPQILKLLPTDGLKALLSTNSRLRTLVHEFINSVSIDTSQDIELLKAIALPGLKQLSFQFRFLTKDMSQLCTHTWPNVVNLSFASTKLSISCLRLLVKGSWPSLQHLNLSGTNLYGKGMAALQRGKWPNLRTLLIKECNMNSSSIASLAAAPWPCLEHLQLAKNSMLPADFAQLCRAHWPELSRLDLFCVFVTQVEEYEAGRVTGLVTNDDMDPAYMEHLRLAKWRKLSELRLMGSNLGLASIKSLVWSDWSGMRDLDLCSQDLCVESFVLLGQAHWPNLHKLDISCTGIENKGMAELVKGSWPRLKCLDGSCNSRSLDTTAIQEMVKGDWPLLEKLNLNGNRVGAAGMTALVRGRWPLLNTLDLNCVGLDIIAVQVLLGTECSFPLLEYLELPDDLGLQLLVLFDPTSQVGLNLGDNYISVPDMVADGRWLCLRELHFSGTSEGRWFLTWDSYLED